MNSLANAVKGAPGGLAGCTSMAKAEQISIAKLGFFVQHVTKSCIEKNTCFLIHFIFEEIFLNLTSLARSVFYISYTVTFTAANIIFRPTQLTSSIVALVER